ncbi:hypothetical protein ABZ135_32820 [Streptomyces sp. NPDC006339]|uniref:hypothetical protein n=1 Tax=Streptomyces sp. NPDC006339 TaxID=3156755 RepID=UPI0033B177D4
MAAVPRQVHTFVHRVSLAAAGLLSLLMVWALGQSLLPVVTFLVVAFVSYGSCQWMAQRLLSRKKSRRRPARAR